jgi:glucose/mannose transport system substrate-binding protein
MNSMTKRLKITVAALAVMTVGAQAADVEVLHWWTSGGEAAALNVLKKDLEGQGIGWQDMPVAGGGGEQAMTVLRARVTSGNAPTAVQMLGFDITDWAKQGALANLNGVADAEGWDAVVPDALKAFSKYDGKWVAAPVNVHSTNWVWANKAMLDELGIAQPTSWDELVAAMREGQGFRQDRCRPWRPGLAGRDDLRRRRHVDRRTGILPEGLRRPRSRHARLGHDRRKPSTG